MFSAEILLQSIDQYSACNTIWLGFSGGVDSHALLHALFTLKKKNYPWEVKVVHVNHQLHPKASQWVEFCQNCCQSYGFPLIVYTLDSSPPKGASVEAFAREKRYEIFKSLIKEGDLFFTAHHKDDQAETFLLQLFRGAGIRGLSGIRQKVPLGQGTLVRPLLQISREAIEHYAKENHLTWIQDPSNTNDCYDRNYIRHHVLPVIKQRWPSVSTTIARTASHCLQSDIVLWNEARNQFFNAYDTHHDALNLTFFSMLTMQQIKDIIRYFFEYKGYKFPTAAHIDTIFQTVIGSKYDKNPELRIGNAIVRRNKNLLYLEPFLSLDELSIKSYEKSFELKDSLKLPFGVGTLRLRRNMGIGLDLPEQASCIVRFRRGGETIQLFSQKISKKVKKLLNEWNVPPWQRKLLPFVYYQNELVAIVGYWLHEKYQVSANQQGVEFYLETCN